MDSISGFAGVVVGVLVASCFVKIFTVLTILRAGIGLWQWEFGVPMVALTLALTAYVMEPYVALSDYQRWSDPARAAQVQQKLTPFLRAQVDADLWSTFGNRSVADSAEREGAESAPRSGDETSMGRLVAVFLLSQLREAFHVGLALLVPFVVLDLVVMNLLMVLGVTSMNPEVVAFPLKLLLFFSVDGWSLLAEKLLGGY